MDWTSLLNSLGNIGGFIGNVGGPLLTLGGAAYNLFNQPSPQGQQPPMYTQQTTMGGGGMGGFDWGGFLQSQQDFQQSIADQFLAMQQAMMGMNKPSAPDPTQLRQSALANKAALQERGLYSGGAVTPESLAAMMGINDPDLIYKALSERGQSGGLV